MTDQAAAGERGPSGLQNEHDIAAKAAAKKAKKQRQKANKKLTQAQIQDASSSSPAHTSKPQSSTVGSSKSQHSNASSPGSRAVGSIVESRTAEQIKQESADAAMLNIFRCPITKVSSHTCLHRLPVFAFFQAHSRQTSTLTPRSCRITDVQHVTHLLCICVSSVILLGKALYGMCAGGDEGPSNSK